MSDDITRILAPEQVEEIANALEAYEDEIYRSSDGAKATEIQERMGYRAALHGWTKIAVEHCLVALRRCGYGLVKTSVGVWTPLPDAAKAALLAGDAAKGGGK